MFKYGGIPRHQDSSMVDDLSRLIELSKAAKTRSETLLQHKLDVQKLSIQLGVFEILKKLWHEIDSPFANRKIIAVLLTEMEMFLNNIE
jgi:hypothetical protein